MVWGWTEHMLHLHRFETHITGEAKRHFTESSRNNYPTTNPFNLWTPFLESVNRNNEILSEKTPNHHPTFTANLGPSVTIRSTIVEISSNTLKMKKRKPTETTGENGTKKPLLPEIRSWRSRCKQTSTSQKQSQLSNVSE